MTLNELKINETGYIKDLNCPDSIKRRLLDLGLIKGTKITPLFVSPSGDPTAFEIRGSVIAIRVEDTMLIDLE
jgi:ferrous iron transport protein A